jgi:dienelactone hydrolase
MGGTVHLFDRRSRTVRKLMAVRPALAGVALAPMRAVEIAARDGQTLVAYLTVPAGMDQNGDGRPDAPLPLVLAIRDPAVPRDHAAFRVDHQWLANRGYAVLSVNFRGSIGFGKAFQALGAGAFGAGLQADLEDALNWVVQAGVAAPGRLATLGEGLAGAVALTLAAGLQRPVACTAALGPVIDPLALPERERTPSAWARFVGAGRSPADIARITGAGIAARINAVAGRVFLVAGPPQESAVANLAAALQAAQKAVVLVEPGDAVRPLLDRFFAACLGGRSQGLPTGADASIRLGAEVLAGAP